MKYLVHLHTPKELSDIINQVQEKVKDSVERNNNFLHCTLFNLSCDEKYEQTMIEALQSLRIKPFSTRTENIEIFDELSLVLRLERNEELLRLHYKILEKVKKYSEKYDPKFYEFDYNPHITLAKLKKGYIFAKPNIQNIEFSVEEICLSKKIEKWDLIKKFKLN